jgi:hypothetical protein
MNGLFYIPSNLALFSLLPLSLFGIALVSITEFIDSKKSGYERMQPPE